MRGLAAAASSLISAGELWGDPLVGIERQDPVVRGNLRGVILLRAVAGPLANSTRSASRRAIATVSSVLSRVDDDDLVGPGDGLERGLDVAPPRPA